MQQIMIYLDFIDFQLKVLDYLLDSPVLLKIIGVLFILGAVLGSWALCKTIDRAGENGPGPDDWYGGGDC